MLSDEVIWGDATVLADCDNDDDDDDSDSVKSDIPGATTDICKYSFLPMDYSGLKQTPRRYCYCTVITLFKDWL